MRYETIRKGGNQRERDSGSVGGDLEEIQVIQGNSKFVQQNRSFRLKKGKLSLIN